jgi:sigma-B regulation protein RsbU (phosphoserine phosphatase)
MFYGVIDTRARRLTYCNAGHLPPLLLRRGQARELTVGGGIIGMNPNMAWRQDSLVFEPGDVLVAYTDGLSDAMNFTDETFGRKRVEAAARAAVEAGQGAEGVAKHVLWEMRRFAGLQTRADDVTIVVVKAT